MSDSTTTLRASLKALPRAAWILFLGTFLNKFGTFVIPFLALYLTRQGYSMAQAGFALGAYGIGHLVASAVGGQLADTIGRRNTIVLSMISAAICMMLLSQARAYPVLLGLAALTGLACELYRPASSALLADLVSSEHRVTAYSTYRLALNAGWAFGPATAGFVAEKSFFWLFAGDAASSLLFGLVAWLFLPCGMRTSKTEAGWSFAMRAIRANPEFLRVLAASVAIALVMYQMTATFGLHVTHCGLPSATYGMLISLNGLLVVLFELPLTTVTRRLQPRDDCDAGLDCVCGKPRTVRHARPLHGRLWFIVGGGADLWPGSRSAAFQPEPGDIMDRMWRTRRPGCHGNQPWRYAASCSASGGGAGALSA